MAASRKRTLEDRFWAKVHKTDGCWIWRGARTPYGYGQLRVGSETAYAHRIAYSLAHGPLPDGSVVCHHCDNPACVRADHLFIGTHADNCRDKILKGRAARKLDPDKVRAIRRSNGNRSDLAREYGVDPSMIDHVRDRTAWTHVV